MPYLSQSLRHLSPVLFSALLFGVQTSCSARGSEGPAPDEEHIASSTAALSTPTNPLPYMFGGTPSATLLNDGRVWVAGGVTVAENGSLPITASALVYAPTTNAWSMSGTLLSPRNEHHAVRLADGRVLVTGGFISFSPVEITASAEIFDPVTGTFSAAVPMRCPRVDHDAVSLLDGRILVAGGDKGSCGAEIYDPASNTWVAAPGWTGPVHGLVSLTRLGSGKILALFDSVATVFDPAFGTWTPTAGPHHPRRGQRATLLGDGRVLVVGGEIPSASGFAESALAEIYDPVTATWSDTSQAPTSSSFFTSQLLALPSGDALLLTWSGNAVARYLASAGAWILLEPLGNIAGASAVMDTGKILIVEWSKTTAHVYDPAVPGSCIPTTCAAAGKNCGTIDDGCGMPLSCGSCDVGQVCSDNVCAVPAACVHSECVSGQMLVPACSACAQTVCAADPYCCSTSWDRICVSEAEAMCGTICGAACVPTTCAAAGKNCGTIADGCGETIPCGACAVDQVCSDNVCVLPSACAHSECASGGLLTPTCSACAQTVCAADPYCCSTSWDNVCVNEAKSMCSVCP